MRKHKFAYDWTLKGTLFAKDKGKVFSCFAGGGGSSFGYKLAGFDVIGCNEIDPRMMYTYCQNHDPKLPYLEPIQTFKLREDLPAELYNLDVLDGSPPCSSFSMAGVNGGREKGWGKHKKFREGQAEQILDTLFFDFIDLTAKLQPKVAIAENVKGLLLGNSIAYVTKIYDAFDRAGYYCQHWLLDAQTMGVPQRRQRVLFVCLRKDLAQLFLKQVNLFEQKPALNLDFDEPMIPFSEIADFSGREIISPKTLNCWNHREYGDTDLSGANKRLYNKDVGFTRQYAYLNKVCCTLTAKEDCVIHFEQPKYLGQSEVCKLSSFPQDYNFCGQLPHYVCGMSVPPVMIAQIATRIWEQWLSKI
jgi:DNA (cytosine-5)-methyltransferase 1